MRTKLAGVYALAVSLAACGGGGGSSDSPSPPPPPPPPPSISVSGTAAKGAAIAGATVDVKCATGSATATTGADGTFTATVASGALPCVLRAPLGDGSYLHSAIGGTGAGTFTANISPLTELVVASAAGIAPETLFADFAARTAAVTTTALTAAVAQLTAVIDLAGINPLSDALVVGNAQDQKIDALMASIASSGTTLAGLSQTVAATSPTAPVTATSGTPSLPAALLLQPAAANCAALRSGTYRVVFFEASGTDFATEKVTIDATTLAVTAADGTVEQPLVPVGNCRFSTAAGDEIVVSQAGVIAVRAKNDAGNYRSGVAFPEQAHTVAEFAGVWNTLEWTQDASGAPFHAAAGTFTFGADGKLSAVTYCDDVKTNCTTPTGANLPVMGLTANASGGFNLVNTTDNFTSRVFLYRAGGGELMGVNIGSDGGFTFITRQRTNTLPDVGVKSRNWDLTINTALLSPGALSESGNTIKSADGASAYVRTTFGYFNNGSTFATFDQALQINQPRNGYNLRPEALNTPTSAPPAVANTREFVAMGLRGMGFSVVSIPFTGSFTLSVAQPGNTWVADELVGKAFAANCSSLRSGTYRVVLLEPSGGAGLFPTDTATINATTLAIVNSDGSTNTATPNGNCRFSSNGGDFVVSQAGVIAIRSASGAARLAFPAQSHSVAELAGTWNKLGFSNNGAGTFVADAATATIDAAGSVSAISFCADVANCATVTGKTITHAPNAGGGFDRTSSDGWTDRVFAYRAGSGDLMLVNIGGDGSVGFWTQQRSNGLSTVGTRTRTWDLLADNHLAATLSESANTIVSVDAATSSAVRGRKTSTGASYNETLKFNTPRDGYNFRPAAATTASDGTAVNIREFTSLGMRGMGFSPLKYLGVTESLMISVTQP